MALAPLGEDDYYDMFFNLIVFVEVQARNFFILGYEGYDFAKTLHRQVEGSAMK